MIFFLIIPALILSVNSENLIKLIDNRVTITWEHHGSLTHFKVILDASIDTNLKDSWLGIGFNINPNMANASVVLCRNNFQKKTSSVHHYLNTNAYNSFPFDLKNLSVGLKNSMVKIVDGKLHCSFDRQNNINKQGYYKITDKGKFFIIAAYGPGKNGRNLKNYVSRFFIQNFIFFLHRGIGISFVK